MSKRGDGMSGGGGGGLTAAQKEENLRLAREEVDARIAEYRELERSIKPPTWREIERAFERNIKIGNATEKDLQDLRKLYEDGIVGNPSSELYKAATNYRFAEGNEEKLMQSNIGNIYNIRTEAKLKSAERSAIVRDFGSYLFNMGKYSDSNQERLHEKLMSVRDARRHLINLELEYQEE